MTFILGKKIGMTRIFSEDGEVIPVTVVEAGPVTVVQVKTEETDGYRAVQVGYGNNKKNKKPVAGHLKDLSKGLRHLKEFIIKDEVSDLKRGDKIDVSVFGVGDTVKVSGISKAKGFQGVVKRHGFHGAPASHGHKKMLRRPGSIGQRFPQHTLKGMRMAGRMGGTRITVRELKVSSIDKENNIMAISGAVPGRKGTLLEIVKM